MKYVPIFLRYAWLTAVMLGGVASACIATDARAEKLRIFVPNLQILARKPPPPMLLGMQAVVADDCFTGGSTFLERKKQGQDLRMPMLVADAQNGTQSYKGALSQWLTPGQAEMESENATTPPLQISANFPSIEEVQQQAMVQDVPNAEPPAVLPWKLQDAAQPQPQPQAVAALDAPAAEIDDRPSFLDRLTDDVNHAAGSVKTATVDMAQQIAPPPPPVKKPAAPTPVHAAEPTLGAMQVNLAAASTAATPTASHIVTEDPVDRTVSAAPTISVSVRNAEALDKKKLAAMQAAAAAATATETAAASDPVVLAELSPAAGGETPAPGQPIISNVPMISLPEVEMPEPPKPVTLPSPPPAPVPAPVAPAPVAPIAAPAAPAPVAPAPTPTPTPKAPITVEVPNIDTLVPAPKTPGLSTASSILPDVNYVAPDEDAAPDASEDKAKTEAAAPAKKAVKKAAAKPAKSKKPTLEPLPETPILQAPEPSEPGEALSPESRVLLKKAKPPAPEKTGNKSFGLDRTRDMQDLFKAGDVQAVAPTPNNALGIKIEMKVPRVNVDHELEKAYDALNSGQTESAILTYKNVLANAPDNTNALFGLATLYHRARQLDLARPLYSRLLAIDPQHRDGFNNFLVLLADEAPHEALAELERLEQKNPGFSPIPAQISIIYQKLGDLDKATQKMMRAMALSPENMTYRYNLAIMMDKQKNYDEAARLYRQLVEAAQRGENIPGNISNIQQRLTFISSNRR